MAFELQDLLTAYKKAKREVFHQNLHLSIRLFIDYEKELLKNLKDLLFYLNSKEIDKRIFPGNQSYFTIVKNIHFKKNDTENLVISDSSKRWDHLKNQVQKVEFRIIPDLGVEIHIVSSLWIDFYGKFLECELSDCCYGSRVVESKSSINHFKPYVHEYRLWQQKGLDIIRENFRDKKNVIAITSDFNLFYHHINPTFLSKLDEMFAISLNRNITRDGKRINKLLEIILNNWSNSVYEKLGDDFKKQFRNKSHVGIPIGLSASKVIANLLLKKFDEQIEQGLNPAYYGRYVDDIFIVLNDTGKLKNRIDIWNYITRKVEGLSIDENGIICYEDIYSEDSDLEFNTDKERVFILDQSGGEDIVKEIEDELTKNSSEWRFIPETENDLEKLSAEVIFSDGNQKDGINSLRKANKISIKRLKFANYLNKLEDIVRTHPKYFWKEEVKKLVFFIKNFAVSPDVIYDYTQYIPRILQLVLFSGNPNLFLELTDVIKSSVKGLSNLPNQLSYTSEIENLNTYYDELFKNSILSGLNFIEYEKSRKVYSKLLVAYSIDMDRSTDYFISDLHFLPFKEIYEKTSFLLRDAVSKRIRFRMVIETPIFKNNGQRPNFINWTKEKINESEYQYVSILSSFDFPIFNISDVNDDISISNLKSRINIDFSFLFGAYSFTRGINHLDASRIYERWFDLDWSAFTNLLDLYKQYHLDKDDIPLLKLEEKNNEKKGVSNELKSNTVGDLEIALTSYKVLGDSWNSKLLNRQEPDETRLTRLYTLVNSILCSRGKKLDMIVLPELSLTDFSLRLISEQLRNSNIALITGLDYEIDFKNKTARNRLAYILPIEKYGRQIYVQVIQDKVIPAVHEGNELWNIAELKMEPRIPFKFLIKHKGTIISSLICNEFLNIDYRQKLRGEVDALILLEWNQDLNSYNSLVEATANDLHCFIIQVNNRLYGDTRVRAPFKEDYQRDVARVRGGEDDYYVIAKLDIKSLRLFQMNHVSPTGSKAQFKPVPTGFIMNKNKKLK